MNPWSELSEVLGRLSYEVSDPEELDIVQAAVTDWAQAWMRRAYTAGHLAGVISQMEEGDEYGLDESLDAHHASTKFFAWLKEKESA